MTTLINQVIKQLKALSDSSLQICHNNYCMEIGYEDIIYDNDEYNVNEQFDTPFDVLRNIQHYNLSDDYFYFHNGNLVSFNYLTGDDSPITFSELAEWVIDNDLFNEYDINVITADDMLASIEDNISDNEWLLAKLFNYLGLPAEFEGDVLKQGYNSYNDYLIEQCLDYISDYDFEQLNSIITLLGINYE